MKLWSWSVNRQKGIVAAHNDTDARRMVRMLVPTGRIWLLQRKAGEAMPNQPCVVMAQ